jgi:hypothetical protein
LKAYVATAEQASENRWPLDQSKVDIGTDSWFLSELRPLPQCLKWYQDKVKDHHLFTVDVGPFFRSLAIALPRGKEQVSTGVITAGPQVSTGTSESPPFDFRHVRTAAADLARQIADFARADASDQSCSSAAEVSGHFDLDPDPGFPNPRDLLHIGTTPYPSMMLAYYMGAIDSVESGVVILEDWLSNFHSRTKDIRLDLYPRLGWYEMRAMLAATQLPFFFGGLNPTHRALVRYQQQMTDRMAALFNVANPDAWQRFCRTLSRRTLHTQLGRNLAFPYVNERFYLFELLSPDDFADFGKDNGLTSTNVTPDRFIAEADAVSKDPGCFEGVPGFESSREQYLGMFHLYAAQLRIASYQRASGTDRATLGAKIRSELELAKSLGNSPAPEQGDLDLLEQTDEFDRHRKRLIELQEWLKKSASES